MSKGREESRPFHLARPERPSAQRRGWLNPLAVHAHDPGPRKSAESLSFLAIDAKPDVIARNDRSVGIGLRWWKLRSLRLPVDPSRSPERQRENQERNRNSHHAWHRHPPLLV
jgi:hypothetical protein